MQRLSRTEIWVGIVPAALALFLAIAFSGAGDDDMLAVVVTHPIVALLTFPGFIALQIMRVVFRFGNLHGDSWDHLSIPLHVAVIFAITRLFSSSPKAASQGSD